MRRQDWRFAMDEEHKGTQTVFYVQERIAVIMMFSSRTETDAFYPP
jgi:hypothetical protein